MSMKDLLRTEVEENLKNMKDLELGSKQYESAVESTCKLMDRVIAIDKNADDYDLKDKARETETNLKYDQITKDKRNQMIQNGITVGSIVVSTAVTIWGTLASFKFEKEGTVTTILGRAFVGKLLPKK